MVHKIRVLVPCVKAHVKSVAAHVRSLQAGGHTVVYATIDRPYSNLMRQFSDFGVDTDSMWFVDAVSSANGRLPDERPPNAVFLQSPTMLEMMAMRIEQVLLRASAPHVLVDSLSTLVLYNAVQPVQEFSHYLANRLRTHGVPGDLLVADNVEGKSLGDRLTGFIDEKIQLEAPKP